MNNGDPRPEPMGGFSTGMRISAYRLEEYLGAGGMAVVFRAHDERLGRQVALKILSPALASETEFRQRFMRESRAAALVDHPHIIPVFEAGEADGVLFIATRLVAGGDLKSLVARQGPLTPGRAEWIVSAVASALDFAHTKDLVHRDVNPANMLLEVSPGRPDHVYLSDFGISKEIAGSVSLTGKGLFIGTPDYAAPEQLEGGQVDGRTDQYALGCSAFELLCGQPPYRRPNRQAVIYAQMMEPPPSLSARVPVLASDVDRVFGRVLAKSPSDRYGTCREFAEALRDALGVRSAVGGDSVGGAADPPAARLSANAGTRDAAAVDDGYDPEPDAGAPEPKTFHVLVKAQTDMAAPGSRVALVLAGSAEAAVAESEAAGLDLEKSVVEHQAVPVRSQRSPTTSGRKAAPPGSRAPVGADASADLIAHESSRAVRGDASDATTLLKLVSWKKLRQYLIVAFSAGIPLAILAIVLAKIMAPVGQGHGSHSTPPASGRSSPSVSPDKTAPLASRLTRLTIVPRSKRIVGGQRFTLKLTGLLADGSAAPRTVLAGVRWATDKPRVVTVSRRGVITGHAAGNATVTASAGSVRATIAISVLAVQPPGGPGAPTTGPPVSHPTRSPGSSPQPTQTTTQLPAEPDTGHRHPSSQGARVSVGGAAGSASRAPRTLGLSAFADGNGLPEQIAVMGRPRITRMAVAPVPWPCSGRASVEPDRWHVVMPQSRRGPADCPNASDIREG